MSKILIVSPDIIGARMAGTAIRYFEIAKALSLRHDVTLCVLDINEDFQNSAARVQVKAHKGSDRIMSELSTGHDFMLAQPLTFFRMPSLNRLEAFKIFDLYDPFIIELLEHRKNDNRVERQMVHAHVLKILLEEVALGDYFICASEKQRNFWLGILMAVGKITPEVYDNDPSFKETFGLVPFGIQENPPIASKPAIKGVVPGIGVDDKVVIWGGGLWSWFDPQSVVKVMAELAKEKPYIKLFFMGGAHPNPNMPKSLRQTLDDTVGLSKRMGLYGVNVFFNDEWVPYEERGRYLLEADAGISTHFNNLETTYSFRTRILDYLWADLPIITTDGDSMADLVKTFGLGKVTGYGDVKGIKEAIIDLTENQEYNSRIRMKIAAVKADFAWPRVCGPLFAFMEQPRRLSECVRISPKKIPKASLTDYVRLCRSYVKSEGLWKTARRSVSFFRKRIWPSR